jgi:copper(I)-binding protein
MKQVGSLTLPAGGKLVLAPAGSHVMIVGLRPVPKAGGTVTLTFVFRSGARVTATLPVISAENRPS